MLAWLFVVFRRFLSFYCYAAVWQNKDYYEAVFKVLFSDLMLMIWWLRELLGLEPVSLVIKKGRLRWLGHVEHKDILTGLKVAQQ